MMGKKIDLSHLAKKWPSTIVARSESREFSGGMVAPGTMANMDSQGKGPDERLKIGSKVGYTVKSFIRWLEERAS
jgi:hypothetical protein